MFLVIVDSYGLMYMLQVQLPPRGLTLWILFDVIRNLLESWLDSKIPNMILDIPAYQMCKEKTYHV